MNYTTFGLDTESLNKNNLFLYERVPGGKLVPIDYQADFVITDKELTATEVVNWGTIETAQKKLDNKNLYWHTFEEIHNIFYKQD